MGDQVRLTLVGLLAICSLLQGAKVVRAVSTALQQGNWGGIVWPTIALLTLAAFTACGLCAMLRKRPGERSADAD